MEEAQKRLNDVRAAARDKDAGDWQQLTRLAAEMDASGSNRNDPVREVFALVGDRWTMLLLLILRAGPWRHATLRRIAGALSSEGEISQRMLTLKLRALERDGFLMRNATDDMPPRVDYWLTPCGLRLLDHTRTLLEWVRSERIEILRSREQFDNR